MHTSKVETIFCISNFILPFSHAFFRMDISIAVNLRIVYAFPCRLLQDLNGIMPDHGSNLMAHQRGIRAKPHFSIFGVVWGFFGRLP